MRKTVKEGMHRMITALIVDDEEASRYGLGQFFDYAQYSIQICAYASNGREALDWLACNACDIVITDVKMPEMDGIKLAAAIRERYSDAVQIVFVSGYDDFKYVQSALKLGAADYLLKPIVQSEFDGVMQRAANAVLQKKLHASREKRFEEELKVSRGAVLEQFYTRKLLYPEHEEPCPLPAFACADVDNALFCLLLLRPNRSAPQEMLPLRDLCARLLSAQAYDCVVDLPGCDIGLVLSRPAEEVHGTAYALAGAIQRSVQHQLGQTATLFISPPGPVEALCKAYAEAKRALERAFAGQNNIIIEQADDPVQPPAQSYTLPAEHLQRFIGLLQSEESEPVQLFIDTALDALHLKEGITKEHCRIAMLQLLLGAINALSEQGVTSYSRETDIVEVSKTLHSLNLLEDMKAFVCACHAEYRRLLQGSRLDQASQIVSHIKKVIHRRYHESLTLTDIAQEVFMSVPYLCTLFRQQTGQTINAYLTRYRMQKACEMLADRRYRLSQIGALIGYADAAYFARLFRKTYGMAPNDYRKSRLQHE